MTQIRSMNMSELPRVLEIINDFDEDDAQAAESDYHDNGFDHHFVIENEGQVIGTTGFRLVEGCDQTAWLSWTYINSTSRNQGFGKQMLEQLITNMREQYVRKVFVKVSNYQDPQHGDVYGAAGKLYNSMGFEAQLINKDFYDEDEDQIIMSLTLKEENDDIHVMDEKPNITFVNIFEISETDGAFTFEWSAPGTSFFASIFGKKCFNVLDLRVGINNVIERGGRKIFLTFPSNLPIIQKPLEVAGFEHVGTLSDYYEKGIHELHFVHHLNVSI